MAIKKSDLYSKLWKSCDELRGGMDASQYKDYILVILFVKYVTDKYYGKSDSLIEVPVGGSFKDMIALKNQKNIGEGINTAIGILAEANGLKNIIDVADFDDSEKLGKDKEKVDRLTKLIAIFEDESLNFGGNHADGDDILGDAYEYLMRHFATESGKSKGQFYTPAEVSRIMAKVIGVEKSERRDTTIYDPTCGSGSLLLKAADEAGNKVTIYGQEKDNATRALAKMNMILHGNEMAEIFQGDTITSPEFKNADGTLKTFDYGVANPPFSTKSWSNGINPSEDEFKRFDGYAVPPEKCGDYAFLLHFIKSLKPKTGKGAIILPHGVLFRGNTEGIIREKLIKQGYIKGIIGLPANLFYGTGIPACIIVIDKENAETRKGIFFIDASKGFIKDGNKNRLRDQDLHKIVDIFNNFVELEKYSKMIGFDEIERNEYNLNIPRYIDNSEEEDIQNIEAHLLGDIPNGDINRLNNFWKKFPSLKETLYKESTRPEFSTLLVKEDEIRDIILTNKEFLGYSDYIAGVAEAWKEKFVPVLKSLNLNFKPKSTIESMAEYLLELFAEESLIDKYDIYQHLMNYWETTLKDDFYLITENDWAVDFTYEYDKKGKIKDDTWTCSLLPKELIINRFFLAEKEEISELEYKRDDVSRDLEEFTEENSGDETILEECKNDKGAVTKKDVQAKVKELTKAKDSSEDLVILKKYLELSDNEANLTKEIKDKISDLDKKAKATYGQLSRDEIMDIVVMDKWTKQIEADIKNEVEKISHTLTTRIKDLAKRYDTTLSHLENEYKTFESKVEEHLKGMGFKW